MPSTVPPRPDGEQQKAELEAILSSKLFSRSPSLSKLLSYVCEKYFAGEAEQIKEYTIAVELFRRPADFNSRRDPIVRVEANRLRTKLEEYYRTEGRGHETRISVPSGHYMPVFSRWRGAGADEQVRNGEDGPVERVDVPPAEPTGAPGVLPAETAGPATVGKARRAKRTLVYALAATAGVAVLIAGAVRMGRGPSTELGGTANRTLTAVPSQSRPAVLAQSSEIRIMAGSNVAAYVDRSGKAWQGDRYFAGGAVFESSPNALLRAEESHLNKVAREGDFDYQIPLQAGIYQLHLHFVEMQFGAEPEEGGETSRLFSVFANERPLLEMFDIYADAGGNGIMDERVFTDISPAPDGLLHLSFRSFKSKAILSGIELLPGLPGKMRPIRITTRPSPYMSPDRLLWEPDRYFRGGRSVIRRRPMDAPAAPELYGSERYGHFSYTIPVANGNYTVVLKFSETYFGLGPTNPSGTGPGMRLFDVYCNGSALLRRFDVLSEAGGPNRPIDKVFRGLEPNALGKLVLSFVPVKNYACVNAIEVVPE